MNCNYGKNNPLQATVDHIIPLSRGGSNGKKNTVLACRRCNSWKGSLDEEQFRFCMTQPDFPKNTKFIFPKTPKLSSAEKRRKREAERIRKSPIKQATVPPCLLWEH